MELEQSGSRAETDRPEGSVETELVTRMERAWQVTERPFTSQVPILGPLIVFVREQWNRIATRWYVLGLLEQQNRYNQLILELAHQVADIREGIEDRDQRIQARFEMLDQLIAQQADLISDRGLSIAALAEGASHLSARVEDLVERVEAAPPEATGDHPGDSAQ
jgi:uncharacterized coiled-coil protein SlyX